MLNNLTNFQNNLISRKKKIEGYNKIKRYKEKHNRNKNSKGYMKKSKGNKKSKRYKKSKGKKLRIYK